MDRPSSETVAALGKQQPGVSAAGRSKHQHRLARVPFWRGYRWRVSYGRLITAKCATSWSDWIDRELWLFPDGLLCVRTSLAATVAEGASRTASDKTRGREFLDDEIDALVARHKRNLWIDADQIERADIRAGITTSRANLQIEEWPKDQAAVAERRSGRASD